MIVAQLIFHHRLLLLAYWQMSDYVTTSYLFIFHFMVFGWIYFSQYKTRMSVVSAMYVTHKDYAMFTAVKQMNTSGRPT